MAPLARELETYNGAYRQRFTVVRHQKNSYGI
jgi:hypothetical protein